MRRAFLAAFALCLSVAPAARATAHTEWAADCGYHSVAEPTWLAGGAYYYAGEMWGYAVVYADTGPPTPVGATVTCEIRVNDEPATAMEASGTGVVAGTAPVGFVARPADDVDLCIEVDFADDTPTWSECFVHVGGPPPQEVYEAPTILTELAGVRDETCDLVRSGAVPSLGGTVRVTDDGDLYLLERFWLDC